MLEKIKSSFDYGKFFIMHVLGLIALPMYFLGGNALIIWGVFSLLLLVGGEIFFGKDESDWDFKHPNLFYPLQYLAVIVTAVSEVALIWLIAAPEHDMLGIGAGLQSLFSIDVMAVRTDASPLFLFTALVFTGAVVAIGSVVVGHELTHRKNKPFAHWMGRLSQVPGFFTYFSIRHPYGHHNLVATPADPATAQRGDNFYSFSTRSIIGQYKMTWDLEKERLDKMDFKTWSWRNEALRGWAMEALWAATMVYFAGAWAIPVLIAMALASHYALEAANFIEHYGLIRVPAEPMQVRHAWNSNERMALWLIGGVPRHSHHHADADVEFWHLKPYVEDAPTTILGYLPSMVIALIPPLWHEIMNAKLIQWDNELASPKEKLIAIQACRDSGQAILIRHADKMEAELSVEKVLAA
ncbi:MAG: alkane 1-monooxygenase [Pseudomonadales bacterium]|nr:alkane 1-monooxygenase [Pseudomonadales bacterium]